MNKEFLQNLREQIKAGTVTEQEPMNKHTSFAIGGPADVFVQPATREEIRSAVYCAKEAGIPFFVMGNGSNVGGTWLYGISGQALELLHNADDILSKGQGNYETLHGSGLNIYYLFLCK